MEDINPNEDKKKLKSIQISFSKKEYNIEAYLMECLKVLIPLNMRDIFLGSENIILDSMNTGDIKNMEIFWFNKLTKNRQKSIIECYTSLNKQKKKGKVEDNNSIVFNSNSVSNMENNGIHLSHLNNEKDVNEKNNENVENNMYNIDNNIDNIMKKGGEDHSLNIPREDEIFDNNKEVIIVEHLVHICNNQIKLIKEYISYIKKNIYDLSSISENNNKIKEFYYK